VLTLATLSDGTVIENPRALRSAKKRLHRAELSVARKRRTADKKLGERKKGERRETSKRLNAAYRKLSRVHGDVAAVRADVIHKVTTKIAETFQTVVVEDLAVKNMTRSAKGRGRASKAGLNRSILDAGFGEFRRQLTYKLPLHGGTLVVADRFFASSKTCSGCGTVKKDLSLEDRAFACGSCGLSVNRDLNAAFNLRTFGLKGTYARGHRGRPTGDSSPAATVVETRTKTKALTSAHV
jgi:putative transposase